MSEPDPTEIDLDAMMREIRAEVARRKTFVEGDAASNAAARSQGPAVTDGASAEAPLALGRLPDTRTLLDRKELYSLADFLQFHDEAFVRNAYWGILRRMPDAVGSSEFLVALREGRLAKVEILGRMRYSREGRAVKTRVDGLLVPFAMRTLRRVPVLGRFVGIMQYIIRLPNVVQSHERLEAIVFHREHVLNRYLNETHAHIEGALGQLTQRLGTSEQGMAQMGRTIGELQRRSDRTEEGVAQMSHTLGELQQRSGRTDETVTQVEHAAERLEQQLRRTEERALTAAAELARASENIEQLGEALQRLDDAKADRDDSEARARALRDEISQSLAEAQSAARADIATQRRELARVASVVAGVDIALREHRRILDLLSESPAEAPDQAPVVPHADRALDAFYVQFENRFRGSTDDIRSRVAEYLPDVRTAGTITAAAPLVDLGCGRGEWLQVLGEQGFAARGVDSNTSMVASSLAQGLEVVEADALLYLKSLPDASIGGVTAFHLVEHVAFATLVALFDEALRVLRPAGILVFETPNPENLVVGACNFYLDPTHRHPLPPAMLAFVAQARGFERVETRRLHPVPERPGDDRSALPPSLAALLLGPQDYSIIAYKPMAAAEARA